MTGERDRVRSEGEARLKDAEAAHVLKEQDLNARHAGALHEAARAHDAAMANARDEWGDQKRGLLNEQVGN